ncbi:MAG: hypothetical protein CMI13_11715 [Oleibacter sp.]|nr:hypothetical protein [Thalassolituus sp.]
MALMQDSLFSRQEQAAGTESSYENEVTAEKIRIVRRNTPTILAGNLLGTIPLLVVFSGTDYGHTVLVWCACLYLILAVRLLHYFRPGAYVHTYEELVRYGKQLSVLIFLTGCVWGVAGVVLFDSVDIKNLAYLTLTFVTMIAGSMVSMSSRPFSYILYAAPLMLPLAAMLVLQGGEEWAYRWLGFGAVVYLLATIGFSKTVHGVIDRSIRLKYENLDLIEDLREQTDRANQASADKSRFLAAASHDLRQPLQAVNLYAEVLESKASAVELQQDLANIRQGLDSLNELLDALFDVSRLDSGGVQADLAHFRIDHLLGKLEAQFRLEAHIRHLTFSVSQVEHVVCSDPMLLERVITNLLVNAFRYTEKGGVDVFCEPAGDNRLALHIRDTGIGISEENQEAIFQEFFQVQNQERDRRQGLGLGLAIVRRVLNILQHDIEVRSVPGEGTDFILYLPIICDQPVAQVALQESRVDSTNVFAGLNILVLDNEAVIVNAMRSLLESWGAVCKSYLSVPEALAGLETYGPPDFMIVDYRMPGDVNGCQFVAQARRLVADVPALIVTGDTSDEVVAEFAACGLPYLHKPIKPPQLRIVVSRILKRARSAEAEEGTVIS